MDSMVPVEVVRADEFFEKVFARRPEVLERAHGRVNLLGEHTDYNDGFVLPTAIPQATYVALTRRRDRTVRVASANLQDRSIASFELDSLTPGKGHLDYVQGVFRVLIDAGHALSGFDLAIASDVPVGAGLSSSAALLVATIRGIRRSLELDLDDVSVALLAHRAETTFVGAPVGIMDQFACSLADPRHALMLDTRSRHIERVPLPEADLVVIDSGVTHQIVGGGYRTRRAECTRAAELLRVASLRDLDPQRVDYDSLPKPLGARVRHVVTENLRVQAGVDAMKRGDLVALGAHFRASHASMRDDYEVSVPEVDRLVEIANDDSDVFGARLTGGGFGGCIVALARRGVGTKVGRRIVERYGAAGRLLVGGGS